MIGETVDRDTLRTIASPVVLPARVVAELDALPALDFAEMVRLLEVRFGVEYVEAPASARRVTSTDDVALLEALTQPLR